MKAVRNKIRRLWRKGFVKEMSFKSGVKDWWSDRWWEWSWWLWWSDMRRMRLTWKRVNNMVLFSRDRLRASRHQLPRWPLTPEFDTKFVRFQVISQSKNCQKVRPFSVHSSQVWQTDDDRRHSLMLSSCAVKMFLVKLLTYLLTTVGIVVRRCNAHWHWGLDFIL